MGKMTNLFGSFGSPGGAANLGPPPSASEFASQVGLSEPPSYEVGPSTFSGFVLYRLGSLDFGLCREYVLDSQRRTD